ncbi:MAG: glycosyltransferase family 2 protein [Aeromicrobium sp.]
MSTTPTPETPRGFVASVVIPAHNEERGIARNLGALLDGGDEARLDVVVVCNGCTDGTAEVARSFGPDVRVIELPEPSKSAAVVAGNAATDVFPRVHLDADVALSGSDLLRLLEPLERPGVLATAPRRVIPRDGCSALVGWYYDVWERLPQVTDGLFGRGAFALSRPAQERVSALPTVMSDDLAVSDAFGDAERVIVHSAVVTVWPPRSIGDLLRRRIRVVTGNTQAAQLGVRRPGSATSVSTLVRIAREQPALIPRIGVFLGITVVARVRARRFSRSHDFTTWQRDESSRS